ncbi:hypothetical protein DH09_05465 [Bacillaceae bacterium JMAK1]|nr:hypothetical protein DH09_05465 [Bacillaceae bacterium JMAK1]
MMHQNVSTPGLFALTMYSTCSTSLLSLPLILGSIVSQDAWMIPIVAGALGYLFVLMICKLGQLYPNKNLFEMTITAFGYWLGQVCNVLLVLLALATLLTVMNYSAGFISSHILITTPKEWILAISMTVVIYGVYLGSGPYSLFAILSTPFFFFPYVLLIVLKIPEADGSLLLPMLQQPVVEYMGAFLFYFAVTAINAIFLLTFFPQMTSDTKKAVTAIKSGYIFGNIILFIMIFLCTSVLGPYYMSTSYYPAFVLAQRIALGGFVERVEVLITVIWFITIYFKITVYLTAIIYGIARLANLETYKPLSLPIGMLVVMLTLLAFSNTAEDLFYYRYIVTTLSLIIGMIIPALWLTTIIKKKKHSTKGGIAK